MNRFFCSILLTSVPFLASAETLKENVSLRLNSENGIYAKGDTVCVYADAKKIPEAELELLICDFGREDKCRKEPVQLKEGENLLFKGAFSTAFHQTFRLTVRGAKKEDNANYMTCGILVSPEEFTPGFEEPDDLMQFWNREIRNMRSKRMKPILTKEKSPRKGIEVYSLEINCVGPRPVRGYIAFPEGAQRKSLPAILLLKAASQTGGSSHIKDLIPYAEMGALVVDINAHGMKNEQPKEYYAELFKDELKNYHAREPENRENYYFKWMFLRGVRTLDYICSHKLWDGKHLVVSGSSQGGAQSCFLAGIDSRVTAAVVIVPAMLDQGGTLQGRMPAWPKTMVKYPESSMKNSPYFDPALLLKNTKAEIWCEVGMYDITCPPANVFAAMNQVRTPKTIITFQRNHGFRTTPELRKVHDDGVGQQRMEFIKYAFTK